MQENQPWYWLDPCALERVLVTCFRSRHFLLRTASLFTASGWRVFTVRTRKQMSSTASHKRAKWWNKYHTVWPALRDLQLLPGVLSGALESVRVDSRWFDGKTRLPASFGCLEELWSFLPLALAQFESLGARSLMHRPVASSHTRTDSQPALHLIWPYRPWAGIRAGSVVSIYYKKPP